MPPLYIKFMSLNQCLDMRHGYLVTVNMQHIYEARRSQLVALAVFGDTNAKHCLDGRGAHTLFTRLCASAPPLVQGNVLLDRWLQRGAGKRILVIGSSKEVVERALARYPKLDASVDERHVSISSPADAAALADTLNCCHPGKWDLVAIALGVPKQELLASALQSRIHAPIYCIGGSFEMLAEVLPRSPKLIQTLGLEGVWRLLLEPSSKRIDRLFRSYATFAMLRFGKPSSDALTGNQP